MASFTTVFLLMRSSTAMNSSGVSTLPRLSPTLTSTSSEAPSHTTTLAVVFSYVPSTILTSASGTPIHRNIDITICLGTVSKAFSRSTRFNKIYKIAIQGAPQMAVDKEAISLSRVYSYYSKCNLPLCYV